MPHAVYILAQAEDDLFDIYRHVASADSEQKAERLIQKLRALCLNLAELPDRGHVPPELEFIGVLDYLEVHYKPYRVIYQVIGEQVYVHAVIDGRRDLPELLEQRLLRP